MTRRRLRQINISLLILIVLINSYTIALPFLPNLSYYTETKGNKAVAQSVTEYLSASGSTQPDPSIPKEEKPCTDHCLVIPRMMLNTAILEGPESDSFKMLKKGAWRLPFSSNPVNGGNTVVAAHRFSYTGPRGLFYFLDKLKVGDEIGVKWGGKLYRYKVESSRTVPPTEVSVQQPTDDTRLTLYTCTPLINPVNRLVVVAKPVAEEASL